MADVKISALPTASVVNNADIAVINQGGTTKTASKSLIVAGLAPLASPALTGVPTAPTAAAGTDTTQIATTAFVRSNSGDRYLTTSTTSNSITNGTKTFTVAAGLSYTATQDITIVYDANNHMHGRVTSYSGTTLVVDIVQHSQTSPGPYTQWTINVGGLTDTAGALLSANNLSDVASTSTSLTNLGGVPTSRTISAGTGLTGGGDLTANRTLSLNNTTVVAGNYGSPSQVASFIVDAQGRLTTVVSQTITPSAIGAQTALTSASPLSIDKGGTGAFTSQGAIAAMGGVQSAVVRSNSSLTLAFYGNLTGTSIAAGLADFTYVTSSLPLVPGMAISAPGFQAAVVSSVDLVNKVVTMTSPATTSSSGTITAYNTTTTTLNTSGTTIIDGRTLVLNDVVFLNQTIPAQSGPWVVTGGAGSAVSLTRPSWFTGTAPNTVLVQITDGSSGSALLAAYINTTTKSVGLDPVTVSNLIGSQEVQTFQNTVTPTAWVKPAGAKRVRVQLWSGGGGGASGRKGAAGSIRCGGGGGGSGAYYETFLDASILGATETVTIGAGGTAGGSMATNSTNGLAGGQGGTTSFGAHVSLFGGNGGSGGTNAAGNAGGGGVGGNTGGGASSTGSNGVNGTPSTTGTTCTQASGGGAAGAGITSANAASAGAAGGRFSLLNYTGGAGGGISVSGGNGTSMTALPTTGTPCGASGGGSGGSSITGNAGAGGNGGFPGGGGAGGGAAVDDVGNSGAGGTGGQGAAIITTYFS
jgi:hypothetical protein